MSQDIFCNLASKTFGRGFLNQRRPVFYYGETVTANLYFEDFPDGYAESLENIDKDAASLVVKLGARGATATLTASSWSNISTGVAADQTFSNSNLDLTWSITPVSGYFSFALDGEAILPAINDNGADQTSYQLAYFDELANLEHTVFRNTSTGRIHVNASDAEIEDRITACFNEIVSGVANVYASDDDNSGAAASDATQHSYSAFSLKNSVVTPKVTVSRPASNTINVNCYVPEFEIENGLVYVLDDTSTSNYSAAAWQGLHKDHVYLCKGAITISDIQFVDEGLAGPHGKTGTIDTSGAGFGTLLGSANEKELWMEVMLDSKTVADGRVLLRKRMS